MMYVSAIFAISFPIKSIRDYISLSQLSVCLALVFWVSLDLSLTWGGITSLYDTHELMSSCNWGSFTTAGGTVLPFITLGRQGGCSKINEVRIFTFSDLMGDILLPISLPVSVSIFTTELRISPWCVIMDSGIKGGPHSVSLDNI